MGIRCFVSIDIDNPDLLTRLVRIQRSLEDSGAEVKTVEKENMHITLMFLGDVEESRLGNLINKITEISFKPFKIEFKGVGAFPSISRPRVVWAGVSKGLEQLNLVYKDLETRVSGMGFELGDKGFSPHITLARVRSGRNRDKIVRLLKELENDLLGEMIARHIRLKKSLLTSKGPIYSTITQSQSLDE